MRYIDNGDGTITDTKTGLMWQKETIAKSIWAIAKDNCRKLNLAGYFDWRFPSTEELKSLVRHTKEIPVCDSIFKAEAEYYWSSDTYALESNYADAVHFHHGFITDAYKTNEYCARAVRSIELNDKKEITTKKVGLNIVVELKNGRKSCFFKEGKMSQEWTGSYPYLSYANGYICVEPDLETKIIFPMSTVERVARYVGEQP